MPSAVQPKRNRIESKNRMGIRAVIGQLYRRHGSLAAVAQELDVSRQVIYKWLGSREIAMLKAQARMWEGSDTKEIAVGIRSKR
jgi:transposase